MVRRTIGIGAPPKAPPIRQTATTVAPPRVAVPGSLGIGATPSPLTVPGPLRPGPDAFNWNAGRPDLNVLLGAPPELIERRIAGLDDDGRATVAIQMLAIIDAMWGTTVDYLRSRASGTVNGIPE